MKGPSQIEIRTSASGSPSHRSGGYNETKNSRSDIEIERRRLHRELQRAACLSVVNNLKACINALAPCSGTPPEILSSIFSFLDDPSALDIVFNAAVLPYLKRNIMILDWLTVTHVCRGWRSVAVRNPLLWNTVTFSLGSKWADCMLSRSMQVPISVRVVMGSGSHEMGTEDAARVARHLPRTKVLQIVTCSGLYSVSVKTCLNALVNIPAPILEELCVEDSFLDLNKNDVVCAPLNLFNSYAPCLRDVTLTNVFVPWKLAPTLFKTVHSLQLCFEYSCPDADYLPTLTQFLDVLEAAVDLRSLIMNGYMPRINVDTATMDNNAAPKSLMHHQIGYLELVGDISEISQLLNCLETPSNETLVLWPEITSSDSDDEAEVFSLALYRHMFPPSNTQFSSMDYLRISLDEINLEISCDLEAEQSTKLEVTIGVCNADLDKTPILRHFLMELSLSPICTIHSIWLNNAESFEELAPFLGMTIDIDDEMSPLPDIHRLDIPAHALTSAIWTSFIEALETRKTSGLPLRELTLRNFSMSSCSNWTSKLKEVVEIVHLV